jgi:hypothetical protein
MIEAADELVADTSAALIALRNAIGEVRGGDPAQAKEAFALARSGPHACHRLDRLG